MSAHFLLYGHGGSYNHGAEAITRSTIELLRSLSPGCKITLSTHFAEQDKEFDMPADEFVERNLDGKSNAEIYAPTIERITPNTVCLHVGGDNYCYNNWQRWAEINNAALARGAYSVLWSCSVDPSMIDDEMLDVLKTHHLITARESITYNALIERGCSNAIKVRDIAFSLVPESVDFLLDNYVVVNLSPLVIRRHPLVLQAYQNLINYILDKTNFGIALLPHVVQPSDNDCEALRLLDTYKSERVTMLSDKLSAAQLKYIISRSKYCVTARTHVAIASYSCGIPTLAIGYSSKAAGIASDLGFLNYSININEITDGFEIIKLFDLLRKNGHQV